MINDHNRHRLFRRLKLKPKLLLNRGKKRRCRIIANSHIIRSPLKLKVVSIGEIRLIDNDTARDMRELFGNDGGSQTLSIEIGTASVNVLAIGSSRHQLRAAFSKHKIVRRQYTSLLVELDAAAFSQQRPDHAPFQLTALL